MASPSNRSSAVVQSPSPSHYDADFYVRKISRIEADNGSLSEEVARMRLRLRRAQDFQLKFDVLCKEKLATEEEVRVKDEEVCRLHAQLEGVELRLRESMAVLEEYEAKNVAVQRESAVWREKNAELEGRLREVVTEGERRNQQKMEREINHLQSQFKSAEEGYRVQIRVLEGRIEEQEGVERGLVEKHMRVKREKEAEIVRQEGVVQGLRVQLFETIEEKGKEVGRVREQLTELMEGQLKEMHSRSSVQDGKFSKELQWLRNSMKVKNGEVMVMQEQMRGNLKKYLVEREQLQREILLLRDKIQEIEINHTEQILNLKERLTKIHSVEIRALEQGYEVRMGQLRGQMEVRQRRHGERMEQMGRERQEMRGRVEEMGRGMEERERVMSEERNLNGVVMGNGAREMGQLQGALVKIEEEKERLGMEYQANVTFLNLQLTKLIGSNELKNEQIRELHEVVAEIKQSNSLAVKELEGRWRSERAEREQERERERGSREALEEDGRRREEEWRHRERELERERECARRERSKMGECVDKLEKEVERLVRENGQLGEQVKKEMGRNQINALGVGGVRRELMSFNEKQRVEIQAMKRLEVDQIQKKYQLEVSKLRGHNEILQTELQEKQMVCERLEEELKKVTNLTRNYDKINKEKLIDYQKKMTTLNTQILLTQNLYQHLVQAKSKVVRRE